MVISSSPPWSSLTKVATVGMFLLGEIGGLSIRSNYDDNDDDNDGDDNDGDGDGDGDNPTVGMFLSGGIGELSIR